MAELHQQKLLPRRLFIRRLFRSVIVGTVLLALSLGMGMAGYHWLGKLEWIDSFLDAAMILSGMGPISPLETTSGKIFADCYAIYCGVTLLAVTGVILAPVVHRALQKFHLEARDEH